MQFNFELDQRGYIKKRESFDHEFKQNFQGGDNLLKYIKTLAGMANNKGGQIIFGIKDNPHSAIGMSNTRFRDTDPASIDRLIREFFSPELNWYTNILDYDNKEFGQLCVHEANSKPIICKKNKDGILREGAIYYRYRGETKEIEFAQLKQILDKEKEKEKLLWMQHIQKISSVGPQNVHFFDSYKGEISVGKGKILIDKGILDKINFIKEGHFTEREGEGLPTLKLIGDIEGFIKPDIAIRSDDLYPLFASDLQESLGLNPYQVQCLLWKLKVKGNPSFHAETKAGRRSNNLHKYSESTIPLLKKALQGENYLASVLEEYKKSLPIVIRRKPNPNK